VTLIGIPKRRWAVRAGLVAVSLPLGFVAGYVVLTFMSAVLPPFRAQDDDTLRERIPVLFAYVIWALTSLAVFVAGWHRSGRRWSAVQVLEQAAGSRDL
jgi:hypothetical protein